MRRCRLITALLFANVAAVVTCMEIVRIIRKNTHRLKREVDGRETLIEIQRDDSNVTLMLTRNQQLYTEHTVIERVQGDGLRKVEHIDGKKCVYRGKGLIALSGCSSLTGILQLSHNQTYFIKPLNEAEGTYVLNDISELHRSQINDFVKIAKPAKRRRRKAERNYSENGLLNEAENDLIDIHAILEKLKDEPKGLDEWNGYTPDSVWQARRGRKNKQRKRNRRRKKGRQRWLHLLVAADHSVVNFHGNHNVTDYVLTLINIVSAVYEEESLAANLKIVITRMVFLENERDGQVKVGNSKRSLENVNRWSWQQWKNASINHRHDLAVWLTRLDIGGPAGYAPVNGVCDPKRCCTLNRDEGLSSAFIIAHEMGHVLGMSHDGDVVAGNRCHNDGSIMAPMVAATFTHFYWSTCSSSEFRRRRKNWKCLLDKPDFAAVTLVNSTLEFSYSLNEQCRMEFGDGYKLCQTFPVSDPCTYLWCGHYTSPDFCKTKKGPPLEGTECQKDKWCINGYCEEKRGDRRPAILTPKPTDGGWSQWTDFGPCSRTCGTGARFRSRSCTNPRPALGGAVCKGKSEEYELCNTDTCIAGGDFRAEQCSNFPSLIPFTQNNIHWLPYIYTEVNESSCRLVCQAKQSRQILDTGLAVVDGTPCSYGSPHTICIQGECVTVGCDRRLQSNKTEDRCGVCGGNNTSCTDVSLFLSERRPVLPYTKIGILPKGARRIHIEEISATPNFLALKDSKSRKFRLNGKKRAEKSHSFIVAGSRFHYDNVHNVDVIKSRGPLLDPLIVMIHPVHRGLKVQVVINYTIPTKDANDIIAHKNNIWKDVGSKNCCGGGVKRTVLKCYNTKEHKFTSKRHCRFADRPSPNTEPCNIQRCKYHWLVKDWEPCSHTCGWSGMQFRLVFCLESNTTYNYVDPLFCTGPIPEEWQPCNRYRCPGNWVSTGWNECSASCGNGVEQEMFSCKSFGNEDSPNCNSTKPYNVRDCNDKDCLYEVTCTDNLSKLCSSPYVHRYCAIPSFRQICCRKCAQLLHSSTLPPYRKNI